MSYQFYKVLHILGLILSAGALGAVILQMQQSMDRNFPKKKIVLGIHGLAMVLLLVAGFGLMARTGMVGQGGWPLWLQVKFAIWVFIGAAPSLAMRAPKARMWVWWVVPLAMLSAAYLVINKVGA